MSKVRINFNVEPELRREFQKVFPFRGETTAFFTRCMEMAVLCKDGSIAVSKLNSIKTKIEQMRYLNEESDNGHRGSTIGSNSDGTP